MAHWPQILSLKSGYASQRLAMVAAFSGCVMISLSFLSRFRMSRKRRLPSGLSFRPYLTTMGAAAAGTSEGISNATDSCMIEHSNDASENPSGISIESVAALSGSTNAESTETANANAVDAMECTALEEDLQSALWVSPAFHEKRLAFREAARRRSVAVVTDFDHTLTAPWSTQCHDVLVRNEAL